MKNLNLEEVLEMLNCEEYELSDYLDNVIENEDEENYYVMFNEKFNIIAEKGNFDYYYLIDSKEDIYEEAKYLVSEMIN